MVGCINGCEGVNIDVVILRVVRLSKFSWFFIFDCCRNG